MMDSSDQTIRREARKQYAIWELLKLGATINSGSYEANVIQFEVRGVQLQLHPVHGKWFAINNESVTGLGLQSMRNCISHIKQKGGLPMVHSDAPSIPECVDRTGCHVEILDNGYYISGYGPDGDFRTYRATAAEVEEFLAAHYASVIPKLERK